MGQEADDRPIDASFDAFLGCLGDDQTREDESCPRRDECAMTSSSVVVVVVANVAPTAPPSSIPRCDGDVADDDVTKTANGPSSFSLVDFLIGDTYRSVGSGILGKGLGGCVRECAHVVTGNRYAVKTMTKVDDDDGDITREISILRRMSHPNIVRLVDVIEDDEWIHLVTDLCTGGSLFNGIVEKRRTSGAGGGCYGENDASRMVRELLDAVSYMHERGIVHRDIKAENVLFDTTDVDSPIKVIDFGLAVDRLPSAGTVAGEDEGASMMTDAVGSPYYVAPEVLRGEYDMSCDVWSVGILTYVLLCGYPPFNGMDRADIYRSVLTGRYRFPSRDWSGISRQALDFVRRLLVVDVTSRLTAREALMHPWITRTGFDDAGDIEHGRASARADEGTSKTKRQSTTLEKRANVRGFDLVRWVNRKVHAQ